MNQSESTIQRHILTALRLRREVIAVLRCQSGKVRVRGGYMQLAPAGSPDLIGGWRVGRSAILFGVEVKTATGPVREAQIETAAAWARGGAIYVVARSPEQAIEGIQAALVGR